MNISMCVILVNRQASEGKTLCLAGFKREPEALHPGAPLCASAVSALRAASTSSAFRAFATIAIPYGSRHSAIMEAGPQTHSIVHKYKYIYIYTHMYMVSQPYFHNGTATGPSGNTHRMQAPFFSVRCLSWLNRFAEGVGVHETEANDKHLTWKHRPESGVYVVLLLYTIQVSTREDNCQHLAVNLRHRNSGTPTSPVFAPRLLILQRLCRC